MENNKIIYLALQAARCVLWFCYVLFAAMLVLMAWWVTDPASLSSVEISGGFDSGYGLGDFRFGVNPSEVGPDSIMMSELHPLMAGWLLVRGSIFFVITITILRKCIDVLQSIRSLKTFYVGNIRHFRSIAKWAFGAFLLSCFNFSYVGGDDFRLHLTLAFGPLLLGMGALVLAEIFKEGRQLLQERDLII